MTLASETGHHENLGSHLDSPSIYGRKQPQNLIDLANDAVDLGGSGHLRFARGTRFGL